MSRTKTVEPSLQALLEAGPRVWTGRRRDESVDVLRVLTEPLPVALTESSSLWHGLDLAHLSARAPIAALERGLDSAPRRPKLARHALP